MKIWLDVNPLMQRERTGVANFIYHLTCALLDQARDERFVLWGPDVMADPFPPLPHKDFRGHRYLSRGLLFNLWQKFHLHEIPAETDVYHLMAIDPLPPCRSPRTRKVVTVYDLAFARFPETAQSPEVFRLLGRFLAEQVEQADHILTISQATSRDLQTVLGVAPKKIEVIYPGNDLRGPEEGEEFSVESLNAVLGMPLPERYILSVGTWEPRKNLPTLFRALHSLRHKCREKGVKLCLAGVKGWKYRPIEDALRELQIEDLVVTLGYVPRELLPVLYARAQMFVYPSLFEGFGMPVVEAMACGTPVICSNVSSLPEAAGKAGWLCDSMAVEEFAFAIERLLDDEDLRYQMIEKGLTHAQQFTWEDAARRTLNFYHRLVL